MKSVIFGLTLLFNVNAFSSSGLELMEALDAAIAEATVELEIDHVEAFEVKPESAHEILVSFKEHDEVFRYGCHHDGNDMACHGEDDHDHLVRKSTESEFDHMFEGYEAAIEKLGKTLSRQGSGLEALKSIKVWTVEGDHDHGDDQSVGADVWTKVTYDRRGAERTVFVQCHHHADHDHAEEEMACHYKRSANNEPEL